jgi:aerobic carbon-monoxide dehydrogenase large subunit
VLDLLVKAVPAVADTEPSPGQGIGASPLRKEDAPLLTGRARFADDIARPGAVHACIVRSPVAHARIASISVEEAVALPGVVDVLTSADLPDVRIPMRLYPLEGMERFLQPPLARGKVRYAGEPVAVVIAGSRYEAEDAAELVLVDYEPLGAVLDGHLALDHNAPVLHEEAGTNLAASFTVDDGDVDALFASAHLVVEERIECHRHAAVPLETRGLAAEWDEGTGALTVWGAAKVVHVNRRILAGMLGLPLERLRLIELHVGGGFGARGEVYPEDFLIPFCAMRLGRPVAWAEDRSEHMHATNHSREQTHELAIALDADGRFLALRDRLTNNTGAYVRTHGTTVPSMSAGLLPGPYEWPGYRCEVRHVVTNKTPAGTYRSPGRYEINFARERLIDIAAHRLGRDPLDLRRQNLVPADRIPYSNGSHVGGRPIVYDSGDFGLLVDKAAEAFGYEELRRWRDEDPGDPSLRRGVGLGLFIEKSGIGRWDYARVQLESGGKTVVYAGAASVGQGVETALAQVCAEHLGVAFDDLRVVHGDTATVPTGMGAFGSRTSMLTGTAVMKASVALRARLLNLAADALEIDPDDLELEGNRVFVKGSPDRAITLGELVESARPERALPRGLDPRLDEEAYFYCEDMSFPYGLHLAAVEVDVGTGGIRIDRYAVAYDIGRAINPQLVHGQIVGGAAQGIGGALLEELAYDESGQLVSGSFMDYLIPTAGEVPPVEVLVTEDAPTPLNPLGVKGSGEAGTAAAGAALANAVSDALGTEATRLPLTPERVLELFAKGGRT